MAKSKKTKLSKNKSQSQPNELLKQGSKDDLDMVYQAPPQPEPPVEEVKPSLISRFFSYITTKVQSSMDTKTGKILFGTAFSRTITILFAASVLSGVFPPAIPFAVTAALMSLTAVAVSAIVDTAKTRSLRKLAEESDLLVKNRNALSKQEHILQNINPELSEILKDQLSNRPNPQQQNPQQGNNAGAKAEKALNVGQMMSDSVPAAANFALQTMVASATGNPLIIANSIRTGVTTAATLISGGVNAKYMVDVAKAFKIYISEERQYAGEYRTIKELRQNVEKQEIQTLAIQQLLQEKDYFKFTPQEKQDKFRDLTAGLTSQVHDYSKSTLQEKQTKFQDLPKELQEIVSPPGATKSESILSDARRAHDPFYVRPTDRAPDSQLTKAMASEKTKESVKSIITTEVREHLVSPKKSAPVVSQESFDKFGPVSSEDLNKRKKAMVGRLDLEDLNKQKKRTNHHPVKTSDSKAKKQPPKVVRTNSVLPPSI